MGLKKCLLLLAACAMLAAASPLPRPDSASVPLPGPGLSYGGIPYGSVSGNVADYKPPSSGRALYLNQPNYAPIEHYL